MDEQKNRTIEEIQHDINHVYDHGEPESDAAQDAFNKGIEQLHDELKEAKQNEERK